MLGIVSNCWKKQLEQNVELDQLIGEAVSRGLQVVELRQNCLGCFESSGAECLPDASALSTLPNQYPEVHFNVAVSVPYLSAEVSTFERVFVAAQNAAFAVSGQFTPHLRLVDLTTPRERVRATKPATAAGFIVKLTQSMAEIDGNLSIENARHSWSWFYDVFRHARQQLAAEENNLRLCYDPCNLLSSDDELDLAETTVALSHDLLSMVHFKQRRDGDVINQIQDGDVDWQKQIQVLKQIGYTGPYLFEIAADDDIWLRLESSLAYLRKLGF